MRQNALTRAVVRYLSTTTLHGFKYLKVPKYADRTVWLAWCAASAGCAGALCLVLWARFTDVPTVLSLKAVQPVAVLPSIALCAPAAVVAGRVVKTLNLTATASLNVAISKILRGLPVEEYQLSYLDHLLVKNHFTFPAILLKDTPSCSEAITRCQVDSLPVDCSKVVHKDVTMHGACCVLRPSAQDNNEKTLYQNIKTIEFVLNCPDDEIKEYDLLVHHEGKGWMKASVIAPGYTYFAPLTYKYVEGGGERVIESACAAEEGYSQTACQSECIESLCGCTDPMTDEDDDVDNPLSVCPLVKLVCLWSKRHDHESCNCNPPCKQIRTSISLKQNPMYGLTHYITDPLYKGLIANRSAVLKVQVEQVGSYVFARMPTESWLTLLSSLGGVFNMFLGVGLFSALELVYFMCISVPLAIRKSREMEITSAVEQFR